MRILLYGMGAFARVALVLWLASPAGAALAAPAWPLKVDADGRRLVDQNGAPFLIGQRVLVKFRKSPAVAVAAR